MKVGLLDNEHLAEENSREVNISLILPEFEGQVSTARRVNDAITSVIYIYSAIAKLRNLPDNGLSMLSCDSGSDKVFDFSGVGEVIKESKELLLSVWSLCIFHKEKKYKERIDAVSHALPLLKQLSEMERDGQIEKEVAEIVRRKVVQGVELFMETGSSIPEMAQESHFAPTSLLKAGETLVLNAPKEIMHSEGQMASARDNIDGGSETFTTQDEVDSMSVEQLRAEVRKRHEAR